MRNFGELLTEYMGRTGITDSELARTLGVRRQTIFRWKEGLVARPRLREDVLRCAAKLRLTPAERDELLLAAGFAPENPEIVTVTAPPDEGGTRLSEESPVLTQAPPLSAAGPREQPAPAWPISNGGPTTESSRPPSEEIARTTIAPSRARLRPVPKWPWVGVIVLALIGVGASWLFLSRERPGGLTYPVAAPGETLIVVGRFVNSGPGQPTYNVEARIQSALEREIQGARQDRVRIVVWPEEIKDASAAEAIRQQARARLVIWGTQSSGNVNIRYMLPSNGTLPDGSPLGMIVSLPADPTVDINAALPEEVQALALLTLGQLYLDRADWGQARAGLTQALSRPPAAPDSEATIDLYMGYVNQVARPRDLNRAVEFYSHTIDLAPNSVTAYLNRGVAYVQLDQPRQWQADLQHVVSLQPDNLGAQQALCWAFGLDMKPDLALPHCDQAVARDTTAKSRDARGVVYAELGRLADAAADFRVFLDWLAKQPESLSARYTPTRTAWIESLKAGTNPIDKQALEKLRQE